MQIVDDGDDDMIITIIIIIIVITAAALVMIMYLENAVLFLQIKDMYINVTVCMSFCVLWWQYA